MEQYYKGKRVALLTLGCKVNQYETDAVRLEFEKQGARIVEFSEEADIYIVNTCSVTNIADRKSRQMLHRAKKQSEGSVVVAMGCYAQVAGEKLLEDECVDVVIGNNRKNDVPGTVREFLERGRNLEICDIAKEQCFEELSVHEPSEMTRAYIKIQDGCNQFCTYCIIPYARGRIRSRTEEDIANEAKRLAEAGYREIVLTGIHISSYGMERETSPTHFEGNSHLLGLIKMLDGIEGIERIRLSSLEPRVITPAFARVLADCKKVCPHFHLSLQSGCDEVLKRMNRHYDTEAFAKTCEVLRENFDNPAITTDVIVGFPGETEGEFDKTKRFCEGIRFAKMHIFKYSRRKGTIADKMPGQITESEKSKRSTILQDIDTRLHHDYLGSFVGKTEKVLFEESFEKDGKTYFAGLNERYARICVEVGETEENLSGSIVDVTVAGFFDEATLLGKILN